MSNAERDHAEVTREYTEWSTTKPEGSAASVFIQWKGTDLCMDFYCPCGGGGHVDGYGAYSVRCTNCGKCFDLSQQVLVRETGQPFSDPPRDLE